MEPNTIALIIVGSMACVYSTYWCFNNKETDKKRLITLEELKRIPKYIEEQPQSISYDI
jgi:hypothetical protein